MTGLFTGIIGSLIGAGIQATVGGIQISEDASKALDVLRTGGLPLPPANWFSPSSGSNEPKTPQLQVYDKIGQHITGALQILEPCKHIVKLVGDVAYQQSGPATAATSAWTPREEYLGVKPSFYKSAQVNEPVLPSKVEVSTKDYRCRCLHGRKTTSPPRSTDSSANEKNTPTKFFNSYSKSNGIQKTLPIQKNNNIRSKIITKSEDKSLTQDEMIYPTEGRKFVNAWDSKPDKLMFSTGFSKNLKDHSCNRSRSITKQSPITKGQKKLAKTQTKSSQSVTKKCEFCQAGIKNVNKAGLMPCGHFFCYRCLTDQKHLKCPKCGLKSERI